MAQNKQHKPAAKEPSSTSKPAPKNSWVWIYFLALILLLFLGAMVKQYVPLFEFYIESAETIPYKEVAPGWASSKPVRSVLEPWLRWDTVWYLKIAKYGYQPASPEVAFPPLYPLLIRGLAWLLGGQFLIASLLISWGAFFGVCYLLNERIEQHHPDLQASKGIWQMIFFPTAFFFFAGYTESLFLLLVLLAWRYANEENWGMASLLGSATILIRFVGIFLLLPFGYMWWKNKGYKKITLSTFAFGLFPVMYFAWMAFAEASYGISPSDVLSDLWVLHFDWPWAGFTCHITKFWGQPILVHLDFVFNMIATIAVVWALFWWLKRKGFAEILFIGSIFGISLMKISDIICLVSISRYVLPLFPIFLVQPSFLARPKLEKITRLGMVLLWLLCATLFFAGLWIA